MQEYDAFLAETVWNVSNGKEVGFDVLVREFEGMATWLVPGQKHGVLHYKMVVKSHVVRPKHIIWEYCDSSWQSLSNSLATHKAVLTN